MWPGIPTDDNKIRSRSSGRDRYPRISVVLEQSSGLEADSLKDHLDGASLGMMPRASSRRSLVLQLAAKTRGLSS